MILLLYKPGRLDFLHHSVLISYKIESLVSHSADKKKKRLLHNMLRENALHILFDRTSCQDGRTLLFKISLCSGKQVTPTLPMELFSLAFFLKDIEAATAHLVEGIPCLAKRR